MDATGASPSFGRRLRGARPSSTPATSRTATSPSAAPTSMARSSASMRQITRTTSSDAAACRAHGPAVIPILPGPMDSASELPATVLGRRACRRPWVMGHGSVTAVPPATYVPGGPHPQAGEPAGGCGGAGSFGAPRDGHMNREFQLEDKHRDNFIHSVSACVCARSPRMSTT